jgi:cytochrome c553
MNVYDSRRAWPDGTRIKALRIVQVLPRPNSMPDRRRPMIGYATDNGARVVLGTVPVESDGSAHFTVPAGKPLYFQALDGRGLAVQSMRSDAYFQAGEVHACQGCHEDRHRSPPVRSAVPLALRRAPSPIQPEMDGSNPLSFPKLVQPVFDAHCVACHAKSPKAPNLSAGPWEKNRHQWYSSYENLRKYAFFYDSGGGGGWNRWVDSSTIPGQFGALASPLFHLLEKGHYDVKLSPADLRRITLWLDANAQFFGSYEDTVAQARGEIVRPKLE